MAGTRPRRQVLSSRSRSRWRPRLVAFPFQSKKAWRGWLTAASSHCLFGHLQRNKKIKRDKKRLFKHISISFVLIILRIQSHNSVPKFGTKIQCQNLVRKFSLRIQFQNSGPQFSPIFQSQNSVTEFSH